MGTTRVPASRHFDFSVPGGKRFLVGDGKSEMRSRRCRASIGINQVERFLSSARRFGSETLDAFSLTFGGVYHRRYAILLSLPSLIFWTAHE